MGIRSHSEIMGHGLGLMEPHKPHLTLHEGPNQDRNPQMRQQ